MTVTYKPMAVVQSSFKGIPGTPIQLAGAPSAKEQVHILPQYAEGLIELLGRAYAGTVNILEYLSRFGGSNRIRFVLGGMHQLRASQDRLEATVHALE